MPYVTPPPLYQTWADMRAGCRNPRLKQWMDYGGRGITICPEWDSFRQFESDMSPKPPGTRLERIDNDKGYSKENCRWATPTEQQRNQRVTRKVVVEGVEYIAADLADLAGVKTDTIVDRAGRGLAYNEVVSPDRLMPPPINPDLWKISVAVRAMKTHCPQGHVYGDTKTRQGWRRCAICHREKERERNRLKRLG